uniref:Kinetochore-associated protein 1 isoform X2 n=1 Tax=Pogona vitticeps TaxID=103695 RepID=A0ABM5F2B4_9SAUR
MWDDVELLASDDTGSGRLSIQSRQESGRALYQINTLVKITSSERVSSNPELYACNSSDGCVLVADRTVVVLDNICQSLQMFVQFETEVDVVSLCQEGNFLVAGERSGKLHLIHVSSKQTLLTNMLAQKSSNGRMYLNLILEKHRSDSGTYHAFVVTNNGFFCILHLPLAKTQEAIGKMDVQTAKKLQGQIETCFISTEDYHTRGCLTAVAQYTANKISLIIGGAGNEVITVWEVDPDKKLISIQNVVDSSMIKAAKKLQVVDSLLFVLDNENVLSSWDIYSLIMTWDCPSFLIEDFLLTSESDVSANAGQRIANLKLVALTTPEGDKQMKSIMVFSLPAMHQLYFLEVANVSSLVQSGINTDTIYFLEGMCGNTQMPCDVLISFLVMRCLTEALPENRLSRLLHKQKFTEAENFAVQFGLDVELVHKVKMTCLLGRLVSESAEDDPQSAWPEFVAQAKETLNKIKDDPFVVEYCIKTPWPTYEITQEMLSYAQSRLLKRNDTAVASFSARDPVSLTEVLKAHARLITFYGAFGPEKFSGSAWLEFLNNKNTFRDVLLQLKEGSLSSAQYLWLRHEADFRSGFTATTMESLLNAIPATVSLKDLCRWLREVVLPFLRQVVPHGQSKIAKWLEQRARDLELTDKANWPENGLEMAEVFFSCKERSEIGPVASWHLLPSKENNCTEIRSLRELVTALQGLVDLYRKFNCKLALCDFEKETANRIAFRMFDKVLAAELIPVTLEKYIGPYMHQHNLQKDEILLQYVKDLLQRHSVRSTSVLDTTWEAKAIAVLSCVSDVELVFEGVLAIMQSAVVPWSPEVEHLVQRYLNMDHAKVKLLQEGYRLMEMKKVLRNYGIRDTNLLNDKHMILRLVKYILKQDTSSSVDDALKMVNAFMLPAAEVYLWRIANLIDKEKVEDVLDLLKALPPSEAVEVAERALIWGREELERGAGAGEEEKMQLYLKKGLGEIVKFLLRQPEEDVVKKEVYKAELKLFKTLAVLQENFGICLSPKNYGNPSVRSQLLEENIETYENTGDAGRIQKEETSLETQRRSKGGLTRSNLWRLASLLDRTKHEMGVELARRALDTGKVDEALKICRDFYENDHNEQTGQLLFSTCQKLCHTLGSDPLMVIPQELNLPAEIHKIACQAATLCSPDLTLGTLELCKYTSFALELSRKCQIEEDYGFISKATSTAADKDPYTEWVFDDFFVEDGAVLDPPAVLPLIYEIASSMVPVTEHKQHPLDSVSLPYCPLKQGMSLCFSCQNPISVLLNNVQECSQHELASGLIILTLSSLFQHMITNNMDIALGQKLHDQKTQEDARGFLLTMVQSSPLLIKGIVTALLHKVFNSSLVDHNLALGYCTLLPKEAVFQNLWDIINKTAQNYSKILAVSLVGAQLARLYEDVKEKEAFEELIVDAEWGFQLAKLGISFQNLFRTPPVRKKELLKNLVQHPDVGTHLVLKYCSTYQLDTDAALQLWIETRLWNASTSHVEREASGKTSKPPDTHAAIVTKAVEAIPLLNSATGLVTSLSAMLHKLDPYDYETIESLLAIIEKAGAGTTGLPLNRALMLIKHLKSYKRLSPPGDLELQYLFEQAIPLSPAAQTRLPFHLIFFRPSHCFWKIIPSELSEESFPELLLISKLMKFPLDPLYVSAANHLFQKKLKPKILKSANSRGLPGDDKDSGKTVQTIQSYLASIANPEWATALALNIAQELPAGPIKVQALKICLDLAKKWLKNTTGEGESREKAQVHLKKLQVQHQRSATEAVLTTHRLDSEDHLKLIGKPAKLIVLLYQHSSIAERLHRPTGRDDPDIHAAAKEIAEINDLDMKKIWEMLLEKWLCPNVLPTDKTPEHFGNLQEDEDFKRVIYLLQLQPLDHSLRILYEYTVSTTSPVGVNQLTFAHRSRALKCLLYLGDSSAVESLFKKPIEKVKYFLKCLIYLTVFETLNIPYTYESFRSAPKEGMIKGLWKNHNHEPLAVRLVAELSLEYQLHDPVLWNGLLQKLIYFKMIHPLRRVLVAISGVHSLWQVPNFSRAWQSVILAPFLSAVHPLNSSQQEACYESFKLLLTCPVLADLDLIRIAKQYAELGLSALALGCLLLIPQPEKKNQQIRGFLASCHPEVVFREVEQQMSLGEGAGFASQIRRLILDYILNETFEAFPAAKYSFLLKFEEMDPDKVKGLVKKLVHKGRIDDAASLITESLKRSGNPLPPEKSPSEVVKMYFNGELA